MNNLGSRTPINDKGYIEKKGMGNLKETSLAITISLKIEVA
jgi:hypothetical protein